MTYPQYLRRSLGGGLEVRPVSFTLGFGFLTHPVNTTVDEYSTVTFSVDLSYYDTLQWYKNGEAISGATDSSYSFQARFTNSSDTYKCVATSGEETIHSNSATLTVLQYGFLLDGLTQYMTLDSPIVIPDSSDFTISVTGTFDPSGFYLLVEGTTQQYRYFIHSNGNVYIPTTFLGTISESLWGLLSDGEVHTIKISREGSVYNIDVDGTSEQLTDSGPTIGMTFDTIGAHWGSSTSPEYFGVYSNLKITIDAITVLDLPINYKKTKEVQFNIDDLSENLSTLDGSVYRSNEEHYNVIASLGFPAEPGTYWVSFTNNGTSNLWYRLAGNPNVVAPGDHFEALIVVDESDTSDRNYIATWGEAWEGTFGEVIFKKLNSKFATIINYNEAGWTEI